MFESFVSGIDDCADNSCVNGDCQDGVNKYTCSCQEGWEGENCDQSKSSRYNAQIFNSL